MFEEPTELSVSRGSVLSLIMLSCVHLCPLLTHNSNMSIRPVVWSGSAAVKPSSYSVSGADVEPSVVPQLHKKLKGDSTHAYQALDPVPVQMLRPELFCFSQGPLSTEIS